MSTASPAKRRKKNDSTAAATTSKGPNLDFFFGKKRAPAEAPVSTPADKKDINIILDEAEAENLTDEELARRLQAQWDKEDAQPASSSKPVKRELVLSQTLDQEAKDHEFAKSIQNTSNVKAIDTKQNKIENSESTDPAHIEKSAPVILLSQEDWEEGVATFPFDEDPLTFDPYAYKTLFQCFPEGKATYSLLTRAFVLINSTRSRIKIVDTLVNFLRTLIANDPQSLLPAVWLTTNDIGPPYEQSELGLGGSTINKALLKVGGITRDMLRSLNNKYGDAGDVAFEAKIKQRTLLMKKPSPLLIRNVYASVVKISTSKGQGSQETKQRIVERLLVDAKGEEVRFLARTLVQHLRIGAVKTTMLIGLARAFLMTHPDDTKSAPNPPSTLISLSKEARTEIYQKAEEIVKQCFARQPNYNDLVPALLEVGLEKVQSVCKLGVHTPLKPMLGSITRDLPEMLARLGGREFTAEYKYDGQRAQVHCDEKGRVTIFSRHLEKMTDKYPDLVALVPSFRGANVQSFIMEGEVVAIDTASGDLKTFQTLANRGRKDVAIGAVSITVCLYAFDLMYLNGEELLQKSFRERRRLLREEFVEVENKFTWVKSMDANAEEQDLVLDFFKGSLDAKCEGIMVKLLDNELPRNEEGKFIDAIDPLNEDPPSVPPTPSKRKDGEKVKKGARRKPLLATYEPDKRLESWLKVKKDYDSSTDTLDVIPIAAWHGMGRKSAWWSPVLVRMSFVYITQFCRHHFFAVRNPETGSLEAVCKCMSGFSDTFYKEMRAKYTPEGDNTCREKKSYIEAADLRPAIWFEPQEVWEIVFADLTLSPTYTSAIGLVSEERGISLRFPRFLRKREDKSIEEASTSEQLAVLFRKQERSAKKASDRVGIEQEEMLMDDD